MPTEEGKAAVRQAVKAGMRGESQQRFAERAGVDQGTLSDFLSGNRWPINRTLNKIETALNLKEGTLAALGEKTPPEEAPKIPEQTSLADATPDELTAELTYRIKALTREIEELKRELAQARQEATEPSPVTPFPDRFTIDETREAAHQAPSSKDCEASYSQDTGSDDNSA